MGVDDAWDDGRDVQFTSFAGPLSTPIFTPSLVSQSQFPLFFLLNLTYLFLDEQQQPRPRVCIYEQNDKKLEA